MRKVEINNLKYHGCFKWKTPVELVSDKLIMCLDGLHTYNSLRQIYHPKCKILEKDTIVLDVIFRNYFQESLFGDVICENCSSGGSG